MLYNSVSDHDFYGLATHEWIGIILPYESQKNQIDGNSGFGYRFRVAIMGYHPLDSSIKDEEIVFALVALGVSDGSGAAGRKKDPALSQGDVVLGKFLDGDRKQNPIILNVLGRSSGIRYGKGRFDSKTGFVGSTKKGNLLNAIANQNEETNENIGLNSPRAVSSSNNKRQPPIEQMAQQGLNPNVLPSNVKLATPPPKNLDQTTINTVKNLIEANPPSEKIQNAIKGYKNTYPEVFNDVSPIDNDLLSSEEQIKRFNLIKTHRTVPVPDSITTGFHIVSPNACKDSTFDQMESNLKNFFSKINAPGSSSLNLPNEIKQMSKVMSRGMNGYVNKITGSLNDKMAGLMSSGFDGIATSYQTQADLGLIPYSKAIELIKAEQEGLLPSISSLLDGVNCVGPKIMNALTDTLSDLLTSAMKNVTNVPACAVEQMMGAVTHEIANTIDDAITPLLTPLTGKFGIDFDIQEFVLGGVDVFKRVDAFLSCDDKQNCSSTDKTIIGKGNQMVKGVGDLKSNFKNVFDGNSLNTLSNASNKIKTPFEEKYGSWDIFGGSSSNTTSLSSCNTGNPFKCGAPTVDIFGGEGVGAAGKIIFGKFINRLDTEDIFAAVKRTASIVGVEITDPGSGYTEDPIVKFNDNCNQGFGAYARAHIDSNPQSPTYGQLSSITILTSGENYPVEDDETPLFISKVIIENQGEGYNENDTLENFNLNIIDGRIVGGKMINDIPYDDLPNLNINSDTGVGAILRPIMSKTRPQGEVVQVIDCISGKRELVGYVNGVSYYGPFHFHPTTGVKMVGVVHTTLPHEIIYDTPEQSFGTAVSVASTMTVSSSPQTNVSSTTTQTTTSSTTQTNTTNNTSQQTTGQSNTSVSDNTSSDSGSSGSGGSGYGGGY